MTATTRSLMRPIVLTALGGAFAIWLLLSTWGALAEQRDEHATLAAASAALRPTLATADAATVRMRLDALGDTLADWQLAAAAFSRDGAFVAGDARLRSDGLPVGQDAAPPTGRQVSIVPSRDGYVLLVRDPRAIARFRLTVALEFVVSVAVALVSAFGFGFGWARARTRSIAQARDDFRAIAGGQNRPPSSAADDPAFGEIVTAATSALERLVRALHDRTDAEDRLRTFLADAGHELRTPLAIAVGYLGILNRSGYADAALAERIARDVGVEHERLTRLVERILHLARLDAVPADVGASSDVVRVAREAVALVRPLDMERAIVLDDCAVALASIGADDLRDALRNLLENAIRHAPGAPIVISIAIDDDDAVVEIRDAGPGMDAFTATHAFDRFFRGPSRGETTGTGLGLAIVRRIVDRAGGTIELESSPGRTILRVRIPRADRADGTFRDSSESGATLGAS